MHTRRFDSMVHPSYSLLPLPPPPHYLKMNSPRLSRLPANDYDTNWNAERHNSYASAKRRRCICWGFLWSYHLPTVLFYGYADLTDYFRKEG